jgi:hypothetical protein
VGKVEDVISRKRDKVGSLKKEKLVNRRVKVLVGKAEDVISKILRQLRIGVESDKILIEEMKTAQEETLAMPEAVKVLIFFVI